jgi:Rrf2 family protein
MILSRTIVYGIQATLLLARAKPDRPVSCKFLAEQGCMPGRFLLQVLRGLVTHGILSSHRGIDGGYVLARPADQITLLDIVEAFDNTLGTRLPGGEILLPKVGATIFTALQNASAAERHELRKLTIAELQLMSHGGHATVGAVPAAPHANSVHHLAPNMRGNVLPLLPPMPPVPQAGQPVPG